MSRLPSVFEELARAAPRPAPHPELWDRGRRLRRRDRAVSTGLVLAMVLLVGGLASFVTSRPATVAPAGDVAPGGAIPSRIVDPGSDLEPETDLAIGGASVAFVSRDQPMAVSARDGSYHALDLPGWSDGSPSLALSPSGRELAWQDRTEGADGSALLSVVDLASGDVRSLEVSDERGVTIRQVVWSPGGTWLGWVGDVPDAGSQVGRIRLRDLRSEPSLDSMRAFSGVAVGDDGTLAVGGTPSGRKLVVDPDGAFDVVQLPGRWAPGPFSPSGDTVALRSTPGHASYTLELETGAVLEHPFPAGTVDKAAVRPLGWLDDRLQLLLLEEPDGGASGLVVTTPEVDDTSTWRGSVGSVDTGPSGSLSVAVDLVPDLDGTSSQQLTHDFGEPEWAEQGGGLPAWLAPALGAIAVLAAGLLLVRRGRL